MNNQFVGKLGRFWHLAKRGFRVLREQGFRAAWMRIVFRLQARTIRLLPLTYNFFLFSKKPYPQQICFPKQQNPILLNSSTKPNASIIVVATNLENLQLCLSALSEQNIDHEFEVIIVDNILDSSANDFFSTSQGIKLLQHTENEKLSVSFNKGASTAQGEYLIFMCDYILLQPNCINELIDTLKHNSKCGVVGAKLLNTKGYLLEAGDYIAPSKNIDALLPNNSYLRAVNFSTSLLAIFRDIFFDFGGFSEESESCFEVDLGLRMLKASYTNYYQPLACAVTLSNSRLEECRTLHHELLQLPAGKTKKSVLYIDTLTPTPDKDSGSVDAFNHMKIFRELGYDVSFIPTNDLSHAGKYTYDLQRLGIKCIYEPYYHSAIEYLAHHGDEYELVILCRFNNAVQLIDWVRKYCPRAKVIFNTVDLHYLRELRQAEIERSIEKKTLAYQTRELEISAIKKSDYTLVISRKEKELLDNEVPDANVICYTLIMEIPNRYQVSFEERKDIMFVGGFRHKPNVDAIIYFISDVWPIIHRQDPDIKCYIIGSDPPDELLSIKQDNIIVTGYVADISVYFNRCRLSIAPLRFGAGLKGKVGRSLGYGVPVVATTIAAEGSGLVDKQDLLIADDPLLFAEFVLSIYHDKKLWEQLSKSGLEFFDKNYSFEAGKQFFTQLIRLVRRRQVPRKKYFLTYQRCSSMQEYMAYSHEMSHGYRQRITIEQNLVGNRSGFFTPGYCYICNEYTKFYSDFSYALHDSNGNSTPNWRERMVCPKCKLNNRMRAAIHIFEQICMPTLDDEIYLTEQKTDLYSWFNENYYKVTGSEYLVNSIPYGTIDKNGIRNETLTSLSFDDNVFDFILSFDVFEHIPQFLTAFREVLRCLRPGGSVLFTVPFDRRSEKHIVRATIDATGAIKHLLPPEYHGDPLNKDGVLCFYHFGWDLLDELRNLGFASAEAYLYWSKELGYLGYEQIIFVAQKPKEH